MIKRISLLTRKDSVSPEAFRRHWLEIHGPMVDHVPHVRRYIQNHIVETTGHPDLPSSGPRIDGVVEMWFDSEADMNEALASPQAKAMFADGTEFIAEVTTYIVDEKILIGD